MTCPIFKLARVKRLLYIEATALSEGFTRSPRLIQLNLSPSLTRWRNPDGRTKIYTHDCGSGRRRSASGRVHSGIRRRRKISVVGRKVGRVRVTHGSPEAGLRRSRRHVGHAVGHRDGAAEHRLCLGRNHRHFVHQLTPEMNRKRRRNQNMIFICDSIKAPHVVGGHICLIWRVVGLIPVARSLKTDSSFFSSSNLPF